MITIIDDDDNPRFTISKNEKGEICVALLVVQLIVPHQQCLVLLEVPRQVVRCLAAFIDCLFCGEKEEEETK